MHRAIPVYTDEYVTIALVMHVQNQLPIYLAPIIIIIGCFTDIVMFVGVAVCQWSKTITLTMLS